MTSLAVLGGGPAGLGAALALAEGGAEVTLLERAADFGGNAGSFELAGVRVDYGSHRLHPAASPAVLTRLEELLGDDLLRRPRRGRIRLLGRWLRFPLRAGDLLTRLPPSFAGGVARDVLRRRSSANGSESFGSVLEAALGRTVCQRFYFPYARKIWGMEPDEIAPEQARRRVGARSLAAMVRRALPGPKATRGERGVFLYPAAGFGQISERLAEAAEGAGARLRRRAPVTAVVRRGERWNVQYGGDRDGAGGELTVDHVYSTIPLTALARVLRPAAPPEVREAAAALRFRAMLLVYLVIARDRVTEFDAHYFPEPDAPFTRVSEPKNYSGTDQPPGVTVLCAELPCATDDVVWRMPDDELGMLVVGGLRRAGMPVDNAIVRQVLSRRVEHAYPLYPVGFEASFRRIDEWLTSLPGILTLGRQGLFAHDNTHHGLDMAATAAACLGPDGRFDADAWRAARQRFATHVVED